MFPPIHFHWVFLFTRVSMCYRVHIITNQPLLELVSYSTCFLSQVHHDKMMLHSIIFICKSFFYCKLTIHRSKQFFPPPWTYLFAIIILVLQLVLHCVGCPSHSQPLPWTCALAPFNIMTVDSTWNVEVHSSMTLSGMSGKYRSYKSWCLVKTVHHWELLLATVQCCPS